MNLGLTILMGTLFMGVLIGYTFTVRALEARTRRQAAAQHSLNSQWQELANQRQELDDQWRELDSQWQELEVAQQAMGKPGEHGSSKPVES